MEEKSCLVSPVGQLLNRVDTKGNNKNNSRYIFLASHTIPADEGGSIFSSVVELWSRLLLERTRLEECPNWKDQKEVD